MCLQWKKIPVGTKKNSKTLHKMQTKYFVNILFKFHFIEPTYKLLFVLQYIYWTGGFCYNKLEFKHNFMEFCVLRSMYNLWSIEYIAVVNAQACIEKTEFLNQKYSCKLLQFLDAVNCLTLLIYHDANTWKRISSFTFQIFNKKF